MPAAAALPCAEGEEVSKAEADMSPRRCGFASGALAEKVLYGLRREIGDRTAHVAQIERFNKRAQVEAVAPGGTCRQTAIVLQVVRISIEQLFVGRWSLGARLQHASGGEEAAQQPKGTPCINQPTRLLGAATAREELVRMFFLDLRGSRNASPTQEQVEL